MPSSERPLEFLKNWFPWLQRTGRPKRIPPLDSVPNVNEADVQRIVKRDYPPDVQPQVRAMLALIGNDTTPRVRLAALKIGGGDLARLQRGVECARLDYRNALVSAEYLRHWTRTPSTPLYPAKSPENHQQADWDEYHTWLNATEPQIAPPDT